jgi:putative hydrolase of the HAD superfamily
MFKAVIFDAKGTLVYGPTKSEAIKHALETKGYHIPLERVSEAFDMARTITALLHGQGLLRLGKKGYILETQIRLILLGFDVPSAKKLGIEMSNEWVKISNKRTYPETVKVLKELRKRNLKIALLTAGSTLSYNKIFKLLGIKKYFDIIAGEDTINISKPARKAYFYVLKKLKCNPQEVLFVGDDLIKDYVVPKKLGMHAVLVDHNCSVKEKVEKITSLDELLPIIDQ